MYFAGTVNRYLSGSHLSDNFARSLAARFDAAVAGLDNLIIAWWDGSSDCDHGGSATIVDVCLPARPKFTLQFAKPTASFGNNTVLMETYGALNACTIIKRILAYCQSEKLLQDVVGNLEIILMTDCQAVLDNLIRSHPGTHAVGRVEPILTKIKALSEEIVAFKEASIKLDLYHCHRNKTANLARADALAGTARGQQMSFQCASHHEDVGTRRPGDTIYYNSWERPNNTPSGQVLETELEAALKRHPMEMKKIRKKKISDGLQPRGIKRRRFLPQPQLWLPPTGQAPVRRSARLLARASGAQ